VEGLTSGLEALDSAPLDLDYRLLVAIEAETGLAAWRSRIKTSIT